MDEIILVKQDLEEMTRQRNFYRTRCEQLEVKLNDALMELYELKRPNPQPK